MTLQTGLDGDAGRAGAVMIDGGGSFAPACVKIDGFRFSLEGALGCAPSSEDRQRRIGNKVTLAQVSRGARW